MKGKTLNLHPDLTALLQGVEHDVGFELFVTSGSRDPQTNTDVGGVVGSEHTYSPAEGADVTHTRGSLTGNERYRIRKSAAARGCVRFGHGRLFEHLGIAKDKPQEVIWDYYDDEIRKAKAQAVASVGRA